MVRLIPVLLQNAPQGAFVFLHDPPVRAVRFLAARRKARLCKKF